MIRLAKTAEPAILKDNAATWAAELLAAGDKAKAKSARYGHPQVKAALIAETNKKCAYCESKFLHVTYGDVEHIVAKALDPKRAYEWANLTIACDKCNTNKSDKEGLLDPYMDDPHACLRFGGPWIAATVGCELGKVTVVILKLNRPDLLERRMERLQSLKDQLEAVLATRDAGRRQILLNALIEDATSSSAEFSGCLHQQIRLWRAEGHLPD